MIEICRGLNAITKSTQFLKDGNGTTKMTISTKIIEVIEHWRAQNNQNDNLNENYTKFLKAEAMEHDRTQGKQWNCPTFNLPCAEMDCSLIMGNRAYFLTKQIICQGNPLPPPAPKPMYAIYVWM